MTAKERAEEWCIENMDICKTGCCLGEAPYFTAEERCIAKSAFIDGFNADRWHYPSRGEIPDKDWSKHPLNVSKKCFVLTKRGVGTIARWDNDYRMWYERPRLAVIEVIAWQYFIPPKKEYTY